LITRRGLANIILVAHTMHSEILIGSFYFALIYLSKRRLIQKIVVIFSFFDIPFSTNKGTRFIARINKI
jgi:hypothetical protein